MGGNVATQERQIKFVSKKPGLFSTLARAVRHVLGNETDLSRHQNVGRSVEPAHPIHGAHIVINEPVAVVEYESQRISTANNPEAQADRRTRKLPAVEPNSVSFNVLDRIKLANDLEAIEKRRTRSRTN